MITVNTSYTNLVSQHTLARNTNALQKATERLSTGARINHAVDDAAGVFLDVSLSSQIASMKTANDNTLLATNFLNIANGTLTTVSDCLMRMNDLATQACNGVLSDDARSSLQAEMNSLSAQIDQSIAASNMNGVSTIDRSNMSADLMNKVDVKSLDDLKAEGYVACTAANLAVSANKKFYISSVEELQALATATNSGKTTSGREFVLAGDLDLSSVCSEKLGVSWTPIGDYGNGKPFFRGEFDGNGHVIKNLYINSPDVDYQGLFGVVYQGEVKNLCMENTNVTGKSYVGGLVANLGYESSMSNCYTTGNVKSNNNYSGGLIGILFNKSSLEDSYSTASVSGMNYNGGLVGGVGSNDNNYKGEKVKNCYATGNVEGTGYGTGGLIGSASDIDTILENSYATGKVKSSGNCSGGLVGVLSGSATIKNSYSTSAVNGSQWAGGLVGRVVGASLLNSYATGNVKSDNTYVGGLAGVLYDGASAENCYATGSVEGVYQVGGLVGYLNVNSSVSTCYSTGNVLGKGRVGGLIGYMYDSSSLINSYAKGNATSTTSNGKAGGLVGEISGSSIANSYALGDVSSLASSSGKLVGLSESTSEISNSYATGKVNDVESPDDDKENFDRSVLDSTLWNLTGDNPTLKSSIWDDCGKIQTNKLSINMQVGDSADKNSSIAYDAYFRLNLDDLDLSTVDSARKALEKLQSNITDVTAKQSYIGTQINRLSDIYNSQQIRIENTSAAKSTISDTDYEKEVANMVKNQILQQISTSVLTQSQNISGKIALSLL